MIKVNCDLLEADSVVNALNIMEKAHAIYIYGSSGFGLVADNCVNKFLILGKETIHIKEIDYLKSIIVTNEIPSAIFFISDFIDNEIIKDVILLTRKYGIPTVSIINKNQEIDKENLSDVILYVNSDETFNPQNLDDHLIVPRLYLTDILFFAYVSKHYNEMGSALLKPFI